MKQFDQIISRIINQNVKNDIDNKKYIIAHKTTELVNIKYNLIMLCQYFLRIIQDEQLKQYVEKELKIYRELSNKINKYINTENIQSELIITENPLYISNKDNNILQKYLSVLKNDENIDKNEYYVFSALIEICNGNITYLQTHIQELYNNKLIDNSQRKNSIMAICIISNYINGHDTCHTIYKCCVSNYFDYNFIENIINIFLLDEYGISKILLFVLYIIKNNGNFLQIYNSFLKKIKNESKCNNNMDFYNSYKNYQIVPFDNLIKFVFVVLNEFIKIIKDNITHFKFENIDINKCNTYNLYEIISNIKILISKCMAMEIKDIINVNELMKNDELLLMYVLKKTKILHHIKTLEIDELYKYTLETYISKYKNNDQQSVINNSAIIYERLLKIQSSVLDEIKQLLHSNIDLKQINNINNILISDENKVKIELPLIINELFYKINHKSNLLLLKIAEDQKLQYRTKKT
jgi:hypothetical protein